MLPSAFACSLSFGLSTSSLLAVLVLLGFSEQPKLILICLLAEDFFFISCQLVLRLLTAYKILLSQKKSTEADSCDVELESASSPVH